MKNKRTWAMKLSLGLWRFARQMDIMEATEEINRSKSSGPTRYTYWFTTGPMNFRTTDEIRDLARQIARGAK